MSKLTASHHRLHQLAGVWHGDDQIINSGFNANYGNCQTVLTMRIALDGYIIIADAIQTRDGVEVYRTHRIFGWDERIQKYTLHHFDTDGLNFSTRAEGDWIDSTLALIQSTPYGIMRQEFTFTSTNSYNFEVSLSDYGEDWLLLAQGTYQRVSEEIQ